MATKVLDDENFRLKKLLAETILDVSIPHEALGKTCNARRTDNHDDLGDREDGLFAVSCLRVHRPGVRDVSLCGGRTRLCARQTRPWALPGKGRRFRLSVTAHPAAARGRQRQPQEVLPVTLGFGV